MIRKSNIGFTQLENLNTFLYTQVTDHCSTKWIQITRADRGTLSRLLHQVCIKLCCFQPDCLMFVMNFNPTVGTQSTVKCTEGNPIRSRLPNDWFLKIGQKIESMLEWISEKTVGEMWARHFCFQLLQIRTITKNYWTGSHLILKIRTRFSFTITKW